MKNIASFSIKTFLLSFIPLLLLLLVVLATFLFQEIKAQKVILMATEKQNIETLRGLVDDDIKTILSDLFFLSVHPMLHQMLENDNSSVRQKVADDFKNFCSNSTLYDQIRFLDETGMERIRINFNQTYSSIVPENKLQNKANRYYFADAFVLEPGRVFVSPFDLNIEHGQIEQPLKPMIRIGTPVVDLAFIQPCPLFI